MTSITYVTSYINIDEYRHKHKTFEWRYKHFENIAKIGIQICLYTDSNSYEVLHEIAQKYNNVKIMDIVHLDNIFAYKSTKNLEYELPTHRNLEKDTVDYMMIINSKSEFLNDTITKNPFNSTHFAWIDFSITHVFKNNLETALNQLVSLSRRDLQEKMFVIPGCWNPLIKEKAQEILNDVHWRFCGGFFLGDKDSVLEFVDLYNKNFPTFIEQHKKIIWEVNFWAWLESNTDWNPSWYKADHNESIINIPSKFYVKCLNDSLQKTTYNYPVFDSLKHSSPSYLYHNGKHLLNTRYVNYSYTEDGGAYIHYHTDRKIITENIFSTLDDDSLLPIEYKIMSEENIGLEHHDEFSIGLEDIRLYCCNNTVKFIATNVNYVGKRGNRIIVGDYDMNEYCYKNCKIIQPPNESNCEKNWIPIIKKNDESIEENFIFGWFPMQIGKINEETNKLEITTIHKIISADFRKIRGSTIFIDHNEEELIGIVHYSDGWPRNYYHMLVTLDKETFKPKKYSEPFCFQHFGIEFCIGFTIREDKYIFWISKKDNDAIMVSIEKDRIPLCNEVILSE
jgi:hypothetical protein